MFASAIGTGWMPAVLDTEEELNFVRQAKRFFFASYHSRNLIGGSTNEYVQTETGLEPIAFSDYIRNQSGEVTDNIAKHLHQFKKMSYSYGWKFNFTGCLAWTFHCIKYTFPHFNANLWKPHVLLFFQGSYDVQMSPSAAEGNIPEESDYNPIDEKLFPFLVKQ